MSTEVENYEYNLKMHYDVKRKELEILLTVSMPAQLSNIKTLLWFNVVCSAYVLKFIDDFSKMHKAYLLLAGLSIMATIFAMLVGREKDYGAPEDISLASEYEDNAWVKAQFMIDMLATTQRSIEFNRRMVSKRAKLMHLATIYTFLSTCVIIILTFNG